MREECCKIGVTNFKCSSGWLNRFCHRYCLTSRRITGSGKQLPSNAPDIIWKYIGDVNDCISENSYTNEKYYLWLKLNF